MNFHFILLAVVLLAVAHSVAATPVDPVAQESDQQLARDKRCTEPGSTCYPRFNDNRGGNGGDGYNGTGGRGGDGGGNTNNNKRRSLNAGSQ